MLSNKSTLLTSIAITMTIGLTGCNKADSVTHKEADSQTTQSTVKANAPQSDYLARESIILEKNTPPIHTQPNPDAIKLIPKNFPFVENGYLTVAVNAVSSAPLVVVAADNKTQIGAEIDVARLIADSLGLKLKIITTSWENWPLGIVSGKFDAVLSNIAVTEERQKKYDQVTYRNDTLAFYVAKDSKIKPINGPDDISGLKIIVGSGTNQERLLLKWIEDNNKKGLPPAQPVYFGDNAAASLALRSGRVDAMILPNISGRWLQLNGVDIKKIGKLNGIWSVAVTLKKGTGLANAIQSAINGEIASGKYNQAFSRWNLQEDIVPQALINPPTNKY